MTEPNPYVKGWHDCAESIAILCEIKAREALRRSRLTGRVYAAVYRHAAEIARATTMTGDTG